MSSNDVKEIDIVIVGGGICGLATSLALHRKGIKSVVLERSEQLRATGVTLSLFANGWRALHQLGIDTALHSTAMRTLRLVEISVDKAVVRETLLRDEARCLRRNDLIEALANGLPTGTVRFGCQVVSLHAESSTSTTVLQLQNGGLIKAKVLIGCDGVNSLISSYVGLKPTQVILKYSVRGLTVYPDGHGLYPEFQRIFKDKHFVGRVPVDKNTVYWFSTVQGSRKDGKILKDPESIRQITLDTISGFPEDVMEMIRNSDKSTLTLTTLRCRRPWDLFFGNVQKEAVTVAGDAWHVMGPFLGQGGSAALEDAIVLARCLSRKICISGETGMVVSGVKAREAFDEYLKERRLRVLQLSTWTYLTGLLLVGNMSSLFRFVCIVLMVILFRDSLKHTTYDCGEL